MRESAMSQDGFKRKLAAILSADVEGYSRLMDDDEEATIRTLTSYRIALSDLIQQYRGRVVDTTGDNLMAEFTSVVDAVNCAVEIQRELAERNAELHYNRKMEFRIGVNLGDVIEEEGRIYGDGVNIAARVETMAEAGGICITGRAYDQVANKLGLEYENLGEHRVKNISTPIRVYRVLSYPGATAHRVVRAKKVVRHKWRLITVTLSSILILVIAALAIWENYFHLPHVELAVAEDNVFNLPKGPKVAVLPFDNMSGNTEQDYLSDGLTENIITGLSGYPKLFVIARNSSFFYKGKPVNVQQVAKELGVRYVIEGSVQKTENRLRITVQLIDAVAGHHMWAERYDRELKDIFEIQDQITMQVIRALAVELTEGDQFRTRLKRPANIEAFIKLLKALELYRQSNKEDNARARQLIKESIQLDPHQPESYLIMALTYLEDIWFGSESPLFSFAQASNNLKKAMDLDNNNSDAYTVLSYLFTMKRDHEKAIVAAKQAITLNPSSADAYLGLGSALYFSNKPKEAIDYLKKAIRLNPMPPSDYYLFLGHCYLGLERFAEALEVYKKAAEIAPVNLYAHLGLAVTYVNMGREHEAREAALKVLSIDPDFSINADRKASPNKNRDAVKRFYEAARKAGLPD
jgi:adenylate cyclase